MDTTSHNFTFETYSFGGQAGSCTLYDVAIIDENNIWAVGEINIADTSQNGYTTYNAVHWNGKDWELKRIPILLNGTLFYPVIKSIFAFNENDIWFEAGIHWDGIAFKQIPFNIQWNGNVNKLWGSSSNDLYAVGNNGNIAHYNGSSWTKIESGTELNINDMYGAYNNETNQYEILAIASDYPDGINKYLFQINGYSVEQLSTYPIMWPLFSVWFVPYREYYTAGSGIYQKHLLQNNRWENDVLQITSYTSTSIRGNNVNDVFVVGAFGDLVHFNGVSWKNDYKDPVLNNGAYSKVAVKRNLVVAVGSNQVSINSEAVILVGRRYK